MLVAVFGVRSEKILLVLHKDGVPRPAGNSKTRNVARKCRESLDETLARKGRAESHVGCDCLFFGFHMLVVKQFRFKYKRGDIREDKIWRTNIGRKQRKEGSISTNMIADQLHHQLPDQVVMIIESQKTYHGR